MVVGVCVGGGRITSSTHLHLPPHPLHPLSQVDLHRVAAVVLLRMLQEAPVAGDMARARGVPLMLSVLEDQINEVETVAAGCHILYSITHAEALKGPPVIDLEAQLNPSHPDHLKGTGGYHHHPPYARPARRPPPSLSVLSCPPLSPPPSLSPPQARTRRA